MAPEHCAKSNSPKREEKVQEQIECEVLATKDLRIRKSDGFVNTIHDWRIPGVCSPLLSGILQALIVFCWLPLFTVDSQMRLRCCRQFAANPLCKEVPRVPRISPILGYFPVLFGATLRSVKSSGF
jgi:hypothetical protein